MPSVWLAPRECEVLCLLARKDGPRLRGATFKWAAGRMGISENGARAAAKRAYRKLGVGSKADALLVHPPHRLTPTESCHIRTGNVPQRPAA